MRINTISKLFTALLLSVLFLACDKKPIGPVGPDPLGPGDYMSFADFRALYTGGGDVIIPTGTKRIRGIVISNSANEASGVYRLQDESGAGIYLYTLLGSDIYAQGDVLDIIPSGGGKLTLYNGDLELMNVPKANISKVSGTISITPRVATTADIIANRDTWSSTLVKINNVTSITQLSSNPTGVTYKIADATGELTMFVRTNSLINVNTSGTSVTGYVSIYLTSTQIGIRSASDIQ